MANNSLGLYSQFNHLLPTAFHNLSVQSTGGGGGSQTLAQTLVLGNTTGGNDIIQTSGDALRSDTNADLRLELDGNGTVLVEQIGFSGSSRPIMSLQTTQDNSGGSVVQLYRNSATPSNGDIIGSLEYYAKTDLGNKKEFGRIECIIDDVDDAARSSTIDFYTYGLGVVGRALQITSSNIIPLAILDASNNQGTTGQILSSSNNNGSLLWINPLSVVNQQVFAMNITTTITLSGTVNTRQKLPIGSNTSITAQNGWSLDTVNNRIVYNGVSGRRFSVSASFAIINNVAAIQSVGFELMRDLSGVAQCRTILASSAFLELHDINIVQMNNGEYLEYYYSTTNASMTLSTNQQAGLTNTNPRPFQILITELLYP